MKRFIVVPFTRRRLQLKSECADLSGNDQRVEFGWLIGPIPRCITKRASAILWVVSIDRDKITAAVSPECGTGVLKADSELNRLSGSNLYNLRGTNHFLSCIAIASSPSRTNSTNHDHQSNDKNGRRNNTKANFFTA